MRFEVTAWRCPVHGRLQDRYCDECEPGADEPGYCAGCGAERANCECPKTEQHEKGAA
jgi:hypothetical protein